MRLPSRIQVQLKGRRCPSNVLHDLRPGIPLCSPGSSSQAVNGPQLTQVGVPGQIDRLVLCSNNLLGLPCKAELERRAAGHDTLCKLIPAAELTLSSIRSCLGKVK